MLTAPPRATRPPSPRRASMTQDPPDRGWPRPRTGVPASGRGPAGPGAAARWPRVVAGAVGRVAGAPLVVSFRTRAPLVALTLDDGPHPATTPALLDVLAASGARATFFALG